MTEYTYEAPRDVFINATQYNESNQPLQPVTNEVASSPEYKLPQKTLSEVLMERMGQKLQQGR